MSAPTITQIANGLYRREAMARRLGCTPKTVAVFTAALAAANAIDVRIWDARHDRQDGA
jgi:hypothetical protein